MGMVNAVEARIEIDLRLGKKTKKKKLNKKQNN
jgi:hypothetical protein